MSCPRRAAPGDARALGLLGAASFLETYAEMIPAADIVDHCALKHAPDYYAALLVDPEWAAWLVETSTGAPIGYLTLGPAMSPVSDPARDDIEIHRIYVLSRFQGRGSGGALIDAALAAAARAGKRRVLIGVNCDNRAALAFYERCAFSRIGARTFTVGASVFDDFVLARRI
jgi:diamine N-acetyltransferase